MTMPTQARHFCRPVRPTAPRVDWLQRMTRVAWLLLALALLALVSVLLWYSLRWSNELDGILASQQRSAVSQETAMFNLAAVTLDVRRKVAMVDVQPVNAALQDLRAAASHIRTITMVGAQYAKDAGDNRELIEESGVLFWQHMDNTVGHVDVATLQEQAQQKAIADATVQGFHDLDALVTDPAIRMAISHVNGLAVAGESTVQHVEHVAAHYDHLLTAPKKWWKKTKDEVEAAVIWAARHL